MPPYRSIFLAPEWQHVRYLGWRDAWPHPDFRVMTRKIGPVTRILALNALSAGAEFDRQWAKLRASQSVSSEICLHDLTNDESIAKAMDDAGFAPYDKDKRLLNIATFVIDLMVDEAAMLAAMSSDTRRKIRKAETNDLVFRDNGHSDPELVAQFIASFQKMAGERALNRLNADTVQAMINDGYARLFVVEDADAAPDADRSFLLSYETAGTGFFLYGASDRDKQNDGAGQYLQWGAIKAFKAAGLTHYDMGGLPSMDSNDGIYRFKKGYGGALIDLGVEYGWSGALVKTARTGRALLGRIKSKTA